MLSMESEAKPHKIRRGQAVGRNPRTGEEGGADLARIHDGAEHRPLIVDFGTLSADVSPSMLLGLRLRM